jgi:DNA sulfur modification protein DndD
MVKLLEASGVDKEILEKTRRFLEDDREQRNQQGAVGEYLNLSREGESRVTELLQAQLPELRLWLAESQERHARASTAVEASERRLSAIPEEETIARLRQARDVARRRVEDLEREWTTAEAVHQASKRTLDEREKRLTAEINRQVEHDLARDDLSRILTHSQKVRETLAELRERVLARHVDRIQSLVLEGFRQLLRKSDLVAQLEIDPEDFSLQLYGPRGQRVLAENLSAGERQLLAVSLLWGLARASGRLMPTLIDTPLGRLDSTHRMHLVERYFPFASHQVVLLSTDEEITGSYLETLRPKIGRSYLLDYDSQSGSSTVREGFPENGSR